MDKSYQAVLLLIATTFIAGMGWIFSKAAIQEMPFIGFIGWRFLLASLILVPFCLRQLLCQSLSSLLIAAGIGCIMAGNLLVWIYAVFISETLSEGAFIVSLSMLFVPLIFWPLFGERPVTTFWYALPLAILGLMFLSLSGSWHASSSQLWFLLSALLQAFQFCMNSRFARQIPVIVLTCIQLFCTGIIGIILSCLFETWPAHISNSVWAWFMASVLIATTLRFMLQISAQKMTSAGNAAIVMVLEPVWASLFSIIYYHETLPLVKVIGCLLILIALVVYRGRLWRKK